MKDRLDDFFLNNDFDVNEPHSGHEDRFLRKLNHTQTKPKHKISWKWMSVAASLLFLVSFYLGKYHSSHDDGFNIEEVSPEMAETQSFFISTINQELKEVEKYRNIETETIIEDALDQIEELEDQFRIFKKDLKNIGNERQVIHGMINNYQQRLQILENLLFQLENSNKPLEQNIEIDEFI
ncbi:hypothetical protein [Tenacibaculum agarivorans]|uniref:hypothetical protein n=1 Tax=Tenacibaculum agarivorans TaxID=1908389 RepID=UPI00094BBF63|nr:hypothetical protein [Tenacibaculum agarivorans]